MKPMNAETVVLEKARPFEEELAARLIYDTGYYVFDCLYNRDFDTFLNITSHLWQQSSGAFSHRHAMAAMWEGNLAGIALGFPQPLYAQEFGTGMATMAEMGTPELLAHLPTVAGYIPWLFPEVPEDAWYLLFLSAHPQGRGQGLARNCSGIASAARAKRAVRPSISMSRQPTRLCASMSGWASSALPRRMCPRLPPRMVCPRISAW